MRNDLSKLKSRTVLLVIVEFTNVLFFLVIFVYIFNQLVRLFLFLTPGLTVKEIQRTLLPNKNTYFESLLNTNYTFQET